VILLKSGASSAPMPVHGIRLIKAHRVASLYASRIEF
jgi:hypothetical protein